MKMIILLHHVFDAALSQWLPAHVGIPGNELADSLAKSGALGLPEARESTTQLDERDLLRTIKTQCLQEWKSDAAHDWYRAGGTSTSSVIQREQQSLISRLKSGFKNPLPPTPPATFYWILAYARLLPHFSLALFPFFPNDSTIPARHHLPPRIPCLLTSRLGSKIITFGIDGSSSFSDDSIVADLSTEDDVGGSSSPDSPQEEIIDRAPILQAAQHPPPGPTHVQWPRSWDVTVSYFLKLLNSNNKETLPTIVVYRTAVLLFASLQIPWLLVEYGIDGFRMVIRDIEDLSGSLLLTAEKTDIIPA
ncbi:hypothetical protein LAZ67_2007018 [Cordylochernes scorpioides]|uniref:RNase H type-1 domain-containing protein n=1 Tax=Cordylochernes scorpioides TaxID=51811 RepID=A0ABY6K7A4_9ARAC|nr:hypothetical protein LAZ67_2007018 [Cordylochernes scorpioides]